MKITFKLARTAKKAGGDRYEATIPSEAKPMVVYVPQSISRQGSTAPAKELTITIVRR